MAVRIDVPRSTVLRGCGGVDRDASDGSLKEQLERLPVICRFQYSHVAEFVRNIIDPILAQYQAAVGQYPQTNGSVSPALLLVLVL